MSHRTRIAGLVVGALVALLAPFAWASPSQASTHKSDTSSSLFENCIDWAEYQSAGITGTMRNTEDFFGATGRVIHLGDHGTTLIKQYRWCGYGEGAVMAQITYYLKRGQWIAQYVIRFDYRDSLQHQPAARTL